jgi:hypothetical protein
MEMNCSARVNGEKRLMLLRHRSHDEIYSANRQRLLKCKKNQNKFMCDHQMKIWPAI